jgi:hypothetical protein
MKRMSLAVLTVVVVLSTLLLSVHAGPPANAEGLWQYQPFIIGERIAGCNTFWDTFENGIWTGTFEGTSTEDGKVVVHCSGAWSFNAIVSYEGVVHDDSGIPHSGTLVMSVQGSRPDGTSDWHGGWVILRGTEELATLRGQGTWSGPGAAAPGEWGDIDYEGNVHFEP